MTQWPLWFLNGTLAVVYTVIDHAVVFLALAPVAWLAATAPREQRPWVAGTAALALLAAIAVPAPVPVILAVMAWAGAVAVRLDRFNPTALRWRVNGGLAIYGLAALGFALYSAYTSRLDPRIWAGLIAGGEAASVVAQGRSFLTTIAVWGLWVILPLAYMTLIVQGLLVHPPGIGAPGDVIYAVRARGRTL